MYFKLPFDHLPSSCAILSIGSNAIVWLICKHVFMCDEVDNIRNIGVKERRMLYVK